jgi:ribosomal protein S18 acetylase RimI-like enzyme
MLGTAFLARLYWTLSTGPRMGVWVAMNGGQVVGFIAGCADVRATYWYIARKSGPQLAALAARSLLSSSVLRRLPAVVTYLLMPSESGRQMEATHAAEPLAELLAIAVDPAAQRQGVGVALVSALEEALRAWGASETYRVTTNLEDPQSNGFYRRLGFEPTHTVRHHVLRLQVYRKRLVGQL